MAVSIPDAVFKAAERLARRTKRSRSELYSRALAEYLARHVQDKVTKAMNQVLAEVGDDDNGFAAAASRRVLERTDW